MSGLPDLRAIWPDLPDPTHTGATCSIEVPSSAWAHFRDKHLANPTEPWGDWLGSQRLRQCHDPEIARQILDLIGEGAKAGLTRPLLLAYEENLGSGRAPRQTWLVVLPTGALLVVRKLRNSRRIAVTCFFPVGARRLKEGQRWKAAVRRLVGAFTVADVAVNGLVPPPEHERFPARTATRTRVRFLTLDSWGFATELRGSPWRGRLSPWTAAEPRPPSRPRPFRLKARRRSAPEEIYDG